MANKKISELPAAGALTGAELIETVQGGVNKQTTTQDIADLGGAGGGHTIEDEGTPLTQRTKLNFVGTGVTVTDDSGDDATVVTIPSTDISGKQDTLTAANFGDFLIALTGKTTPVDADSFAISDSEASGDAKEVTFTDFKAFLKTYFDSQYIGIQDFPITASAMWPRTTGGCASLTKTEMATSLVNIQTLDFDQTTQEFAQVIFKLPRKYNNGTITAKVEWTASSGSGSVVWGISGGAYSSGDALTTALGTAQTVTDTLTGTGNIEESPESSSITIAGSPTSGDLIVIQVSRNPADGSDTLTADAKLVGITLYITTTALKDA